MIDVCLIQQREPLLTQQISVCPTQLIDNCILQEDKLLTQQISVCLIQLIDHNNMLPIDLFFSKVLLTDKSLTQQTDTQRTSVCLIQLTDKFLTQLTSVCLTQLIDLKPILQKGQLSILVSDLSLIQLKEPQLIQLTDFNNTLLIDVVLTQRTSECLTLLIDQFLIQQISVCLIQMIDVYHTLLKFRLNMNAENASKDVELVECMLICLILKLWLVLTDILQDLTFMKHMLAPLMLREDSIMNLIHLPLLSCLAAFHQQDYMLVLKTILDSLVLMPNTAVQDMLPILTTQPIELDSIEALSMLLFRNLQDSTTTPMLTEQASCLRHYAGCTHNNC